MRTGYPLYLSNYMKKLEQEYAQLDKPKLLLHQYLANRYFIEKRPRGLLLEWATGVGKTIGAVSISEDLLLDIEGVIFLSKKSLHDNFKRSALSYSGKSELDPKYHFVSLNASNMITQIYKVLGEKYPGPVDPTYLTLDDWLLIVDEEHTLNGSISNGGSNGVGLYELIMKSTNPRLLFLSATPIIKDVWEIGVCFNMLKGIIMDKYTLFGTNYEEFIQYFVLNPEALELGSDQFYAHIKNSDIFGDRITGLVSYYAPGKEVQEKYFPRFIGPLVIDVHMSNYQYSIYNFYRTKEKRVESRRMFRQKRATIAMPSSEGSTYRVMTRQISNFAYPDSATSSDYNEYGELAFKYDIDKLEPSDFSVASLQEYSPKLLTALQILKNHISDDLMPDISGYKMPKSMISDYNPGIGPVIIYSQYLKFGLNLIGRALEANGFKNLFSSGPGPSYGVLSGEETQDIQAQTLKSFTSKDNMSGKVCQVLLISSTAAEGIDTKYVQAVIIYEPHWHDSRHYQVFSRADRYMSHVDLPEELRQVIGYVLLSDYPDYVREPDEPTTDKYLWSKSQVRKMVIGSFLDITHINSIDCTVNYPDLAKCRICAESDELLYPADLAKNIEYGSKCIRHEEQEVQAYPVTYEGSEYYYTVDGQVITIYTYDPIYEQYIELLPGDKGYYDILNYIRTLV